MALSEQIAPTEDIHPIDMVEVLAEGRDWDFDRIAEDQITMVIEGQWRTYAITLAWSARDECLRLVSTFEVEPPHDRLPELYELLNRINDRCWTGAFALWPDQRLLVWRYGLVLSGGQIAVAEQVERLITDAVDTAERYYPAVQLVSWSGQTPEEAMGIAMAKAYGTA